MKIRSNLKKFRKEAGLTMQELADYAGTCKSQIYAMEQVGTNPTLESAFSVADALGLDIAEIWVHDSLYS